MLVTHTEHACVVCDCGGKCWLLLYAPHGLLSCGACRFICWFQHCINCLLAYWTSLLTYFFLYLFASVLVYFWPSVLWRCWLGSRKGIRPVKTEWWGDGVVICLDRGANLHTTQLMPLPLTVSRLVLSFWYRLTWVVPKKGHLTCVCYLFFDNRPILFSDWRSWKTTRQPKLPVVFCVHSDMVAVYFVLIQEIGWEERLWSGLFCVVWHVEPQLHHSVKLCCTACVNRRCWKNCRSCKRLCHKITRLLPHGKGLAHVSARYLPTVGSLSVSLAWLGLRWVTITSHVGHHSHCGTGNGYQVTSDLESH